MRARLTLADPFARERKPCMPGGSSICAIAGGAERCAIGAPTTRRGALGTPRTMGKEDTLPSAGEIGGPRRGKRSARGSDLPERRIWGQAPDDRLSVKA